MQVSLVQLNTALGESMYLPYSVALLQAYTERHARRPERYAFGLPMVHCPDVRRGAEALSEADIVGFSTYVWNANRHRAIARELRARNEQTLMVFGGPHVPDHPEQFLRENPIIDVVLPPNRARVIRLRQAGVTDELFWSIHELELLERVDNGTRSTGGTR